MPIPWKQKEGQYVRNYVAFIEKEFSKDLNYGIRPNKYTDRFQPQTKESWLLHGITRNISENLNPVVRLNPNKYKFAQLVDAVQDAEWIYTLRRKELCLFGQEAPANNPHRFDVDQDGFVVVFTDGACPGNGQPGAKAGIGVWFNHNNPWNRSQPVASTERQTNNVAEIKAAVEAINIVKSNGYSRVAIITDSKFMLDSMTKFMPVWLVNGWARSCGGIVTNKENFQELLIAMEDIDVKWVHVRAHRPVGGNRHSEGNREADRLAREGAKRHNP